MKIIVRDVFDTYLPKYLTSYRKIVHGEHETGKNCRAVMHQQDVNEQQQLNVPQVLLTRRSSTLSRGKRPHQTLARNKSKQQKSITQKTTTSHDKYTHNITSPTILQQQKLNELMPEKLTAQINQFIQQHRFYSPSTTNSQQILQLVKIMLLQCIRSSTSQDRSHILKLQSRHPTITTNASQQFINENLFKLSLYLNKQTNKQIFTVYEYILMANPKSGISYQTLSKRLKTDIINVSHYCCKLKKMRFIDWEHKKQGIIVFPKVAEKSTNKSSTIKDHCELTPINLNSPNHQQQSFSYQNSLIFNELTLNENILVNLCSATSLNQGGLTNEEIKFKIMKHAENKMVRRTVEGMKHVQKNAQRQGKVFEFKYKKQTQRVIKEIDKKRVDGIGSLTEKCRQFLNTTFPTTVDNKPLQNEQLLQHIVNTKLTDYISSIGVRQSKRQCTPLKLNRYISILNYLETQGSETELDLRRHIIEIEKDLQSYQGIIHKRSVIGILEGLKKIGLIYQMDDWFYPAWCQVQKKEKSIMKKLAIDQYEDEDVSHILAQGINGNKKFKKDKLSKSKQKKFQIPPQQIRMISKKEHLNEIFTQLLSITFQKAMERNLRKGFHRIMYAHRKKQTVQMFDSEKTIFHLLQSQSQPLQKWKNVPELTTTLQAFMSQINNFVDTQGKKLQNFPQIEYEYVKYVRRNPSKMADNLRSKYGKSWRQKFQPLQKAGVIEFAQNGYNTLESFNGLLV